MTMPDGEEKPLGEIVKGMVDPLLSAEAGELVNVPQSGQAALPRPAAPATSRP